MGDGDHYVARAMTNTPPPGALVVHLDSATSGSDDVAIVTLGDGTPCTLERASGRWARTRLRAALLHEAVRSRAVHLVVDARIPPTIAASVASAASDTRGRVMVRLVGLEYITETESMRLRATLHAAGFVDGAQSSVFESGAPRR